MTRRRDGVEVTPRGVMWRSDLFVADLCRRMGLDPQRLTREIHDMAEAEGYYSQFVAAGQEVLDNGQRVLAKVASRAPETTR